MKTAQSLNTLWHSVLPVTHYCNLVGQKRKVAYVATFGGLAYAVAIWTTPIAANRFKNGWDFLELRRLAIGPDAPPNTASRMLSVMTRLIRRKWPEVTKLISYQAKDHHAGTIYKAAGWTAAATSKAKRWHKNENRPDFQTVSDKVRWECILK